MIEDLTGLISNVGFPIAVTFYFMYRMETILNNNTKALVEILKEMEKWKK